MNSDGFPSIGTSTLNGQQLTARPVVLFALNQDCMPAAWLIVPSIDLPCRSAHRIGTIGFGLRPCC
eukprot:COSAG01_NODE_13512_length_1574_cov_343.724746_2_plen_65_part_01